MEGNAIAVCNKLTTHIKPEVREAAAKCLAQIVFAPAGKLRAIEQDAVPVLIGLCDDTYPRVLAQAAGALMGIAIADEGKQAIVDHGFLPLLNLLTHGQPMVVVNTIRAISSVAAHPKGREVALANGAVGMLEAISEDEASCCHFDSLLSRSLAPAADKALRVLKWTP